MKHCILLVTQMYYSMLIYIHQSIAEYYICFHILSSSVWQACWPPVIIKACKTFPITGPGGDQLLTPSYQLFLLLQQYICISFNPLCVEYMYVLCYTRICSLSWDVKRKEKYLFNMRGWAGPAPCPLPPLRWRSRGGGGGLASHVLPGDFERGRGDLWQASCELKWLVFLASKFGGLF